MTKLLKIRPALLATLALITAIVFTSCMPARVYSDMHQIRFMTVNQIPVIEGRINGKRAYFIVDTGASCSILNESIAEHFGFKTKVRIDEAVHGLGGQGKINQAMSVVVELGSLRIHNVRFRTKKMDYIIDVIRHQDQIDIAGIIGSDILRRYRISIDYRSNTLSFLPVSEKSIATAQVTEF